VDHMALIYLVNKPQVSGKLVRWLLLFFRIWLQNCLQTW
jgi:hypothetical protein